MTPSSDYRRSASDRALSVRMRGDLQIVEVAFAGQASFVVTDPVAGESFHLSAEEHALLEALRTPASIRSLQRVIEKRFAPRRATATQIQQFVNQLYDQGLVVVEHSGQGAELLARGQKRSRQQRWASLFQILSIRVGSFDAGPLIERLHRLAGWVCSPIALVGFAALLAYSTILAVGNAPELAARLPAMRELARPSVAPLWIAVIVGVKVLHELGHALACRRFGAQPREMGVLLLAGAPSLYCDVSDAWRLPSKWQRMTVSSAGMFVELIIAALAVIVWRYAEPGWIATVSLSLLVVCSVGTLLVNLNPLLRYDGYYLLADWLEVPNLAERARGLVSATWRRWLLGEPAQVDALLGPRKRRAVWAYAILSKAYLALVFAGLFMLALKFARPHHLENAVYTVAAMAAIGFLIRPLAAISRLMANPAARARFRWLRLATSLSALGACIIAILMIPITRRVEGPIVLAPASSHPLFAVAAGELEYATPAGTQVAAGEVVVRLRNPELELSMAAQAGAVRERRVRLDQLKTLQASWPSAARLLPTAAAELADAEAQLAEQEAMASDMVVRAPAAGRVVAPPDRRANPHAADKLYPWQGNALESRNVGAWIEPGTPLAVVVEPGGWVAWAGIEQADVTAVESGQSVRMLADQQPTEVMTGQVTQVAQRARSNRDDATPDAQTHANALGDGWYHVVEMSVDSNDASLLPGARGIAKIATYESTLGGLLLHELQQTLSRIF